MYVDDQERYEGTKQLAKQHNELKKDFEHQKAKAHKTLLF